jgi:hypothetical protein
MSLKTFLKSKFNRILTALTVVAVAGAGISVGAIAANNKAQEADATDDGKTWGLIGGFSGNSWSSEVCLSGSYDSSTDTKNLGPYNIPASTEFKIRPQGTWDGSYGSELARNYGTYFSASSANAKTGSSYGGYYTFVLTGNLYSYGDKSYGTTVYFNSSSSSLSISEYRVKGGTVEGSSFNTETVNLGYLFTPSTPSLSGYSFDGWFTDSSCSSSYSASRFSSNTSLYAKFTSSVTSYTVSLNKHYMDDGTNVALTSETAYSNAAYYPVATPSSNSYTWDNKWYTDSACTTEYSSQTLSAAITLYAKMVRSSGYTITEHYMRNKTLDSGISRTETTTLGSNFTPSTPGTLTVTDFTYTWDGKWYTDSVCTTEYTAKEWTASGDLYANYYVSLSLYGDHDSVGGSWTDHATFTYSSSTSQYTISYTTVTDEKFLGHAGPASDSGMWARWNSSIFNSTYFQASGTDIQAKGAYTFVITASVSGNTITWVSCNVSLNTYTISEYRVLGSTAETTAFATAQATQGTAFEVPAQPADTPTGYTWDGWYTDSACTSAYTSRLWTADGNLYAHYTALVVYEAIVFDAYKGSANAATYYGYGSTYSTLLLASESATAGVNFTPTTTPAARTGYTFAGAWYTDPQCTTVYVTGSFTSNTYLFAKYTLTDTAHDAIYLMLSSIDSSLTLCLPDYRFSYNETTTRYEINQTFSNTTETFKFFDATRTNTLGSNVYGGYFASAFKYDEFTGTADSVITVATTGTYQLSIRYSIGSATANYYGYWYEAIKSGADYSGAEIYLRGPYSDYTSNRSAYKFKWNSTVGDYELEATLTASDAIFFYYVGQTARGGWNQVIFGTTNFNQGALVDSTYRINVATNGTYHLAIKGSIAAAQSGSDWASYWWSVTALSDVTYGYATEYRVLSGTAETSVTDIEKCAVGTSFTPQTLTVPTGYQLKGWSTSGTTYTAYTATSMTSSGMSLYCWFEPLSYDTIYFGATSASYSSASSIYVWMWYHTDSNSDVNLITDKSWPGYQVTAKSGWSCTSPDLAVNFPTGSSNGTALGNAIYKISIPQTFLASVPSGASVHIIISNNGSNKSGDGNNAYTTYHAGGYYQYGGTNSGYVSSDYDTAAALIWDTQKAIYDCTNSSSATNGYHSVCAMSQNTATTLNTRYTNASDTAKTLINAATISQYTLDTTKTAKWNGTAAGITGAQTFARIALIAAGASYSANNPGGIRTGASPISTTLIIVASCGAVSLLSIIGIYLFSKKRRRHSLDHTA